MHSANRPSGFLVINKPAGITSRDAVDQVQAWFPKAKLGHAGTLDPSATGVLIIGIGPSATRLIEYVQEQPKTYVTTFRLGGTSSTDDADGEISLMAECCTPAEESIKQALKSFTGTLLQIPPSFSAAKVQGVRAHTRARRGEEVILQPRQVTVHAIEVLHYHYPLLKLQIHCSKGTYIRSIARDLGHLLGIGGYVQELKRTRIGDITCDQALPLSTTPDTARQAMIPLSLAVAHLPRCQVNAEQTVRLQQGQTIRWIQPHAQTGTVGLWHDVSFLGAGYYDATEELLKPTKMIQEQMK